MRDWKLIKRDEFAWEIPKTGRMRVPGLLFASEALLSRMEETVVAQMKNAASLPGVVDAVMAMPDAHSGYGFPIGAAAGFDPEDGGVICAGGVGFDISCGVRCLVTNLAPEDVEAVRDRLADALFSRIPAGVGGTGELRLVGKELDAMLEGGAAWAVSRGFGDKADLERIEDGGRAEGAMPDMVSRKAKDRQRDETGTLGSGNHYLEVQRVEEIFDPRAADAFGISKDAVLVSLHCGSRGLGHQIGVDYMERMLREAKRHGLDLPDRELACAPVKSPLGGEYLGAMRAGVNCALANRQVLTHLARETFAHILPGSRLRLLYDVSHNVCRVETVETKSGPRRLFVHRKGATRVLGPGRPELPDAFSKTGQPVLVGGSMGTSSYILAGDARAAKRSFASACHGAGRAMSRKQALKLFHAGEVLGDLAERGVTVRSKGLCGLCEEAPGAYKDIDEVVNVSHALGLARKTAKLRPMVCIKG